MKELSTEVRAEIVKAAEMISFHATAVFERLVKEHITAQGADFIAKEVEKSVFCSQIMMRNSDMETAQRIARQGLGMTLLSDCLKQISKALLAGKESGFHDIVQSFKERAERSRSVREDLKV